MTSTPLGFGEKQIMSTWIVFGCIWAMCALCVVLFIRGAHPHVSRSRDDRDDSRGTPADLNVNGLRVATVPVRDARNS
jgi:hypothetical protein